MFWKFGEQRVLIIGIQWIKMSVYISASSIKDMLSCSMKGHHRRFNKDKAVLSIPIIKGTIVHDSLEKHSKSLENAIEFAKNQAEWYNIVEKDWKHIKSSIKGYFSYFSGIVGEDVEIEKRFKFQYSDDVFIVGKWDLISVGNIVYDWKTTKRPPISIDNDPQFIIYHQAYKETYGVYPSAVFYAALVTGKLIKFNPHKAYINLLFDEIIPKIVDDVKNNNFVHDGIMKWEYPCKNCMYQKFCFSELEQGR